MVGRARTNKGWLCLHSFFCYLAKSSSRFTGKRNVIALHNQPARLRLPIYIFCFTWYAQVVCTFCIQNDNDWEAITRNGLLRTQPTYVFTFLCTHIFAYIHLFSMYTHSVMHTSRQMQTNWNVSVKSTWKVSRQIESTISVIAGLC